MIKTAILVLAATVTTGAALAQNVLVDGDFESTPPIPGPLQFGNNIGHSIAPWVLGTGNQANVVEVDGPGGLSYGTSGPESDASHPGAGIRQHYLDIANGANDFYQTFVPPCSGDVEFGGFFSTRANSPGMANVTIRQGTGTSGIVVGTTNNVNLPGGNSATDPWTPVSFVVPVTGGVTYSFVVHMDDNLNFDNGFVRYKVQCGQLKICKVGLAGVAPGTSFTFTAGNAPSFTVAAGNPPGGLCRLGPSFPQGSTVTVTETVPSSLHVSGITVAPINRLVGTPNLAAGSVTVTIGSGITELTYTNAEARTGFLEICKEVSTPWTTGNYTFTVNPGNLGPFTVPVGSCSPAIEVQAGQVTITEQPRPGSHLAGCHTIPAANQGACNTTAGTSTVTVVPGDVSTQTIAFFTNQGKKKLPPDDSKIDKSPQ
jgi:hypothetical protein